jgi:hypothetical protein
MRGRGITITAALAVLGLMMAGCGAATASRPSPTPSATAPSPKPHAPISPSPSPAGPTDPNGVAISDWPDACKLLTDGDMAQTFGMAFQPAQPQPGSVGSAQLPLPPGCMYTSSSDAVTVNMTVSAISPTVDDAQRYFEAGKTVGVKNLTPVAGVGDEAYTSDPPLPRTVMRKARVELRVEVDWVDNEDRGKVASTQLARLATPRLVAATAAAS